MDEATGDQVLPLRFWDSNDILGKIALDLTFHFDDVLDPEKLRSALERLLQIGNWRQMGARYKRNSRGKIEYHIPLQLDENRPGFAWSHEDRQQSISEHRLASQLPRPAKASRPTLYDDASILEKLVTRPGCPTKLVDWMDRDHPPLSVHVVSFTDSTLVTLSWPHVFFDALGRQSLLQAWTAVLDGREEDVPAFVPYEHDPLVSIAKDAEPSDYVLFAYGLTGIWFILFVISFIYELLVHSQEANRTIHFPGSWVNELRETAMADVRSQETHGQDVFLSHGDVLLAFWCKTTLAAQHLRPSRPVHIMNALNIRGLFKELPVPGETAYIGNAVAAASTFTTVGELEKLSVGQLALRVRNDLKKQREPAQIKSLVAWAYGCFQRNAAYPMVGFWNQIIFSWSNWTRAKFYDVDFSSAVVRSGVHVKDRRTKLGQPSLITCRGSVDKISLRNGGPLIGKDANGDWWVNWTMRAEAWSEIEKEFEV